MSRNARLANRRSQFSGLTAAMVAASALPACAETLDEALSTLVGREVTVEGHIGADPYEDDVLRFRTADGSAFMVTFDAGRDARKKLEGCKFELFGGTPCRASVKAEIARDRAQIVLIVFEVVSIESPAEL